ncbi:MAG: dihydrodipicolinate synthase [Clostridiales bacterium]|nr:dihydrodipicolinate synthase [Clostridiales bacterium]
MSLFVGSGVAIITPFDENKKVNYAKLEELINFQIENHTDAIIICGTTGEASTLTAAEHLECIEFAVKITNKRVPVIAGTGSNSTADAIYYSQEAEIAGVDGLLVVTPYYNKATQKGLIEHFTKIANSVKIPLILYNVPSRTGCNIAPKTVYELSKVENIVGLKEASGNIAQVMEIAHLCGENIDIYSGNDDQILPLLSVGGKGVISVVANILPRETHEIVQDYIDGNIKESAKKQLDMIPLISSLFSEVNPIPIKRAMNLMGMNVGSLRSPLTEMEDENSAKLEKNMLNYGIKL